MGKYGPLAPSIHPHMPSYTGLHRNRQFVRVVKILSTGNRVNRVISLGISTGIPLRILSTWMRRASEEKWNALEDILALL